MTEPIIVDIRSRLPRDNPRNPEIGRRTTEPKYITLHYNGGAVPESRQYGAGLLAQLVGDAEYQMRPGGLGAASGGDGLQYHYAVASDGTIYQCRDDDAILWHCANAEGNAHSLSIHVPVGLLQTISDSHWQRIADLFLFKTAQYHMRNRGLVRGHQEWSLNLCPGIPLTSRLKGWRAAEAAPIPFVYYRVKRGLAIVRTAPSPSGREVLRLVAGTPEATIGIDDWQVKGDWAGKGLGASNQWLHLADGRGFIHALAMERL